MDKKREEGIDDFMERADTLARERGYHDKPASELMLISSHWCEKNFETMKTVRGVLPNVEHAPPAFQDRIMDNAEALSDAADEASLEYQAALSALSKEDFCKHRDEMVAKYGPGFLVGHTDD